MPKGRARQEPIYVTPKCRILVIGESLHVQSGRWRCWIREHQLFPGKEKGGGLYVWKNRLVLTERLGRRLLRSEHAHHKNDDKGDDSDRNIELKTAGDHNRHHKIGTHHSDVSRKKTSSTLKDLRKRGLWKPGAPPHGEKNWSAKLTAAKVRKMRKLHADGMGYHRLGKMFGVSKPAARAAIRSTTWSHIK